jgi:hypothetical protein
LRGCGDLEIKSRWKKEKYSDEILSLKELAADQIEKLLQKN